ncbi:MAG: hypothetical protein E8D42_08585 [Nitrospira sp.]|nr:MAG: hypothetical protein E8D42_08585 [Nitrospira sp.]
MAVLRGGSWNNHPQNLRSANRNNNKPTNRNNNIGFRCAKTLHGSDPDRPELPERGLRRARHAESIGLFLCWRGLRFFSRIGRSSVPAGRQGRTPESGADRGGQGWRPIAVWWRRGG